MRASRSLNSPGEDAVRMAPPGRVKVVRQQASAASRSSSLGSASSETPKKSSPLTASDEKVA